MPPLFTLNRSSPRRDYAPGFTKSDSWADRGRPCCRPRGSAYVDRQPIPHEGGCRGGAPRRGGGGRGPRTALKRPPGGGKGAGKGGVGCPPPWRCPPGGE